MKRTKGLLKKAASGVLALLPCSRTPCTLRPPQGLRPCWTDFFEHSLLLMLSSAFRVCLGQECALFNKLTIHDVRVIGLKDLGLTS